MRSSIVRALMVVAAILAWPVIGYAQEATLSGTLTDTTGAVLPGVVVTAVHEASGNSFESVTDGVGVYRIPVRVGVYRIRAELPGFATVTRTGLELLVGQQAVVNLQMSPSTVQAEVVVTGEAPLIDVTQSRGSGNIDPRQMQELPVNGRNWQQLTMLAPGSRANAVTDSPLSGRDSGKFQLNIDGQQVTQGITASGSFGQPNYSRDAIAEFEFIANRFDATQGRAAVQVNAITKSGTNTPSGTMSGYFRHDRFKAADFIQNRVLPYSDQQLSVAFGGPIRRDKTHVFGSYEFEREPGTFTYDTPYPRFNTVDQSGDRREHKGLLRVDHQFSPQIRFMVRGDIYSNKWPYDFRRSGGSSIHPSSAQALIRYNNDLLGSLTQVLSNRAVNEVKVGWAGFWYDELPVVNDPTLPRFAGLHGNLNMGIVFRGFRIGSGTGEPSILFSDTYQVRDDFTYSTGSHNLKLGGEYLYGVYKTAACRLCIPLFDAQGGPIPDNIEDLFPVWNDPTTWNYAALSPITRFYQLAVADEWGEAPRRHEYAFWVQDDWSITPRLTLNLGLRYDLPLEIWGNWIALPPFLEANRPNDTDNIAPRLGAAFRLNDRTVLRGGSGKYFDWTSDGTVHGMVWAAKTVILTVQNDGRPDFAGNPYTSSAPPPTYQEALQLVEAGKVRRTYTRNILSEDVQVPYSYQSNVGVQRQIDDTTSVSADYIYTAARHQFFNRNANLSYNPATGANYPFTDASRRPYPDFDIVVRQYSDGLSNYHGLETALTKRMSQGWQASATYLLSGAWDATAPPKGVDFPLAPDMGGEYALAAGDQRHRAVFNGIWQAGYGFQVSGIYFFGSGERFNTDYGGDLRRMGSQSERRLRPDGTIAPRNNLVGKPVHRVDLRVQRRFGLGGRRGVDGIVEVFNLFNHANYGSYTTSESNRNYGKPEENTNVAYQPRMLQLGFRFAF